MNVLYIRDASGKFIPIPTISGRNGKSAYQYAVEGGYTGTEAEFAQKMAQEIPEPYTLPAATADRLGGMMIGEGLTADEDGRVSVEPEGEYELINSFKVSEDTAALIVDRDAAGNPFELTLATLKISCDSTVAAGSTNGTISFATPTSNYHARVYAVGWNYPGAKINETFTRTSSFTAQCDCRNNHTWADGIYGDEGAIGNRACLFSNELGRYGEDERIIKVHASITVPKNAVVYLYGIRKVNTDA